MAFSQQKIKYKDILHMVKKKETEVNSSQSKKMAAIQAACAALQAKFGKESVNFLGNNKAEPIPRIPTGSIAIDNITGGGYPIGRMIEIFGPAASGKTSLCYHAISEAQKMYPEKWCGFVDSEHTFDPEYAGNIGVNVAELVVAQPDSGTDAFAMVQGMIENGSSLIVVDSVAAMVPREEMEEEDYGKNSIGLQARMMSKGLRKLASIAGKYKCLLIFTNQTRNKIGVMYGCFNQYARVVLADGTTRPIGWIVKNKYDGLVKTVNVKTGKVENKRIINWFDNGKAQKWYKVLVQKGMKQGIAKFIIGDNHTFITPDGEQSLSSLKAGDFVYVRGYNYLSSTDESIAIGSLLGDGSIKYKRNKAKEKSIKCNLRLL